MRKCFLVAVLASIFAMPVSAETWRGLRVAAEYRCAPYDKRAQYPYPQSVERRIVEAFGGVVYGPYTGRCFNSRRDTDIEHIVATSEAHDSGLCAASPATRRRFASDVLNLTLAAPAVNRHQKGGKDAAEWLPRINKCWYAGRVVAVKRAYGLSVDRREAAALETVLRGCASTEMEPIRCVSFSESKPVESGAALPWDDDNNGRITCREARKHGIAPVRRGHPAYAFMRDGDGDGVVCE